MTTHPAPRPAPVLDVEALAEAIRLVVLARDADDWALLDSTDPRIEQAPDLGDAIDDLRAAWRAYQTALAATQPTATPEADHD